MGKIIQSRSVSGSEYAGLLKPIIYCCPDKATVDSAVPLNHALAEKLSALRPKRRTMRLAACFEEILKTLQQVKRRFLDEKIIEGLTGYSQNI